MNTPCPCHSGKSYESCCQRYHRGEPAENALKLMRSRYAAYALNLSDYLIQTTHPNNSSYTTDLTAWKKTIDEMSRTTQFAGLDILEFIDGEPLAWVTFKAHLKQGSRDVSFTEKSTFEKVKGRWLYKEGVILS